MNTRILFRSVAVFCFLASISVSAFGEIQKFVYVYNHSGNLLLPKNASAQCPDPAGGNEAAAVCHGVLVDDNGDYSLRLDSNKISISNLIFIANEYELIPAGAVGNNNDLYALVHSKRRIDNIEKDAVNNGVNINEISEASVKAVENAKHVPQGKKGHVIAELAQVIDAVNAAALNHAMGNSKTDNLPAEDSRLNDYVTAQQQRLNETQQQVLISLAESALQNEDNQQAQSLIRKNVLQGLVEPATLEEVATRVFSHISDLQVTDPGAPIMVLEADKYLVYFNEPASLSTANSINAAGFFAYTWQGVVSETSSAVFSKPDKGSYLVCATGEINNSNESSTDCIRLAVKDQVEAFARASRLRVGTGNSIKLSASLSIGAQTYSWTGSGTFADASAEITTWTAPEVPGTYEITLGINNNEDSDSLTVTVFDVLPLAVAEADPYVIYLQNLAASSTLSSGSISTDGSAVDSLEWSIVEYPQGAQAAIEDTAARITQFSTNTPGDYTIQLLATRRGYTDSVEINIQVRDPEKPRANAGEDQVTYRNEAILLDGSHSYASEGRTLSYQWSTSGPTLTTPDQATTAFISDTLGSFNVDLAVDDGLLSDSDSVTVTVINRAPSASDDVYANLLNVILYGQLIAMDPDNDALTYSLVKDPVAGGVTIDPVSGEFVYVPGGVKGCKYHPYTRPEDNDKGGKDVPVIKLCADRYVIAPGETVNLTASNSINASQFSGYEWLGGAVGDLDDIRNATYTGTTEGLHQVCVKGNIGQSNNTSTSCVDIVVNANLPSIDDDAQTGYVDTFHYEVHDGDKFSNKGIIIITIGWENAAPEVVDLSITTLEDMATSGQLQGSDLDGHDITFSIVGPAAIGTVTLVNATTGALSYTPNPNANGVDTFTYVANDGFQNSQTGTVTITVESTNDAPVAHFAGILTRLEDNSATGMLGATDPDEEDIMDFRLATLPANGDVVITNAQTGAFTYTPHQDLNGSDSFFFVVHDGTLESNAARVDIEITPVNDAPVTQDVGPLTTYSNETLEGTLTGSDVDNDALYFEIQSQPVKGSVSLNSATGAYVYTPNGSLGADSFTYSANDAFVSSNLSTVSITIEPANLAPNCTQPDTIQVLEGTPYGGTLSCTDPEAQPLTYAVVDKGHAGNATVSNTSTGEYIYTPNAFANGADYFTFKASDAAKESDPSSAQIEILRVCQGPGNDKRDSDNDGYADFVEGEFGTLPNDSSSTPFGLTPGFTFMDDDDGDGYSDIAELWMTLSDYKVGTSMPSQSTLKSVPKCFTSGFDTVPPALFAFHILTPNVDATTGDAKARFALTVLDNAAGIAEVNIKLRSPTNGEIANAKAVYSDKAVVAHVELDSETFSQYAESGTWTVINLSVKDGNGNQLRFGTNDLVGRNYDHSLNVTGDVAPAPVLNNFQILTPTVDVCNGDTIASVQSELEDTNFGIQNVIVKLRSPSGDVFNWGEIVRNDLPNTLTATINSNAFKNISEAGLWTVSELSIANGAGIKLVLDTNDLTTGGYSTTIDVITCPPNPTPAQLLDFQVLTPAVDLDNGENKAKFSINASDTEGISKIIVELESAANEILTTTVKPSGSPEVVDFEFDSEAFDCSKRGTWVVKTLSIKDGIGDVVSWSKSVLESAPYYLTIENIDILKKYHCSGPDHLLVAYSGSLQTNEDVTYTGDDTDNDSDGIVNNVLGAYDQMGHALTYTIVDQGVLGTVNITDTATGTFTYTPHPNANGEDQFTYKVSDGYGDSNIATMNVTINAVCDPTVIKDQAPNDPADLIIVVDKGVTYYGNVLATDDDQLPLTYEILANGIHGTATFLSNNSFQYVPQSSPAPREVIEDSFTFQVTDGNCSAGLGTVAVKIQPNPPPPSGFTVLTPTVSSCSAIGVSYERAHIAAEVELNKPIGDFSEFIINLEGPSGQVVGFYATPRGSGNKITLENNVLKSDLAETGIWNFKNLLGKLKGEQFSQLMMDEFGEAGQVNIVYNCPPVVEDALEVVPINGNLESSLNASDPDGDPLTYRIIPGQTKGIVTLLDGNSGTYSYAPVSLEPDVIKFVANDGLSDSRIGVINITVTNADCAIAQDQSAIADINQVYSGTLFGYNPANPPTNSLTFEIVNSPGLGTVTLDSASGDFRYHPKTDAFGNDTFSYRATNGICYSETKTVAVTIKGTNPQDDSITVLQNVVYSGQLHAGVPDTSGLTYNLVGTSTNTLKTSRGTVLLNQVTGSYSFTPDKDIVGPDEFSFKIYDGSSTSRDATVSVRIVPPCGNGGIIKGLDSDGDGYVDYVEVVLGTDPEDAVSTPADMDLQSLEVNFTDDDDGDGHIDSVEMWSGSDPLDANSTPDYIHSPCHDPTSDGIKPRLLGFNIDTPSVDIATSNAVVSFSMTLLDNASGIKRARVSLTSPSGVFVTTSKSYTDFPLLSGFTLDSDPLNQFAEQGTWTVSGITIFDEAGNRLDLTTGDLVNAGFATGINILNTNSDTTAPILDNFTIVTSDIVYAGTEDKRMSVSLTFSDDSSGVASARVDFISASGTVVTASKTLSPNPASITVQLDTRVLSSHLEEGIWTVHSVLLVDAAGNSAQLVDTLVSRGFINTLSVTNPNTDSVAPTLESFSLLTTEVFPLNGDARMSFAITAYDTAININGNDPAGVEKIRIDITGPAGQILSAWGYLTAPYPATTMVQIDTSTLSILTQEGIWYVTSIEVFDDAGNSTLYSGNDLNAYTTGITVSH